MDKKVYADVKRRASGKCEVCSTYYGDSLELHHILRRKVKESTANTIMLCKKCHRGTFGIHGREGHELDIKLKLQVQEGYFLVGKTEDETRELMGGRLYE